MSDSADLTVTLHVALKARLAELSRHTQCDQSVLRVEAISDYVARELAIVKAIERGRADVRAGRVVPHSEVVAAADAIIDRARAARDA